MEDKPTYKSGIFQSKKTFSDDKSDKLDLIENSDKNKNDIDNLVNSNQSYSNDRLELEQTDTSNQTHFHLNNSRTNKNLKNNRNKSRLTKIISLSIVATVTGCTINHYWSTHSDQDKIYTKESCTLEFGSDQCARANEQAVDEYLSIAPKYASKDVCDTTVGSQCVESPTNPGMFIAPMIGFALGIAANNALHAAPLYAGPNPDCKINPNSNACATNGSSRGGFVYSHSGYYGSFSGTDNSVTRAANVSPMFSSQSRAGLSGARSASSFSSVSRGGFGASAHGGGGE